MTKAEEIVKAISEIKLGDLNKEELAEVLTALNIKGSEASWRLNAHKFCDSHFTSIKNS